ncbi:DmsC/YnfH family molybdoenzyme membrane anchor subunit [Cytobacillus sp.]|uniref:dimethyl sulfoxide reductase anchor subunit family protein n=1 Tax=Cytobacillus sp. TaxID=2675269 RepID=UPI0028BF09E8|nr:DmsC/YnfH family molybdoenzyme membrane anchor subunit [Cytobacillus sp.]
MHEWPLLTFTICMQAAIGGIVMLSIFYNKMKKNGTDPFTVMKLPLFVITVLSFIGLGASFAHLGTPTHAFNAILGISHSWMSREIVVTGTFIAFVCATTGLALLQKKVNPVLLIFTAIVGIIDVYCMAAIYSNTLVHGWNHANTFLSFYGTTFTLGAILAVSLSILSLQNNELSKDLLKTAFIVVFAGIALQLIGLATYSSLEGEIRQISGQAAAASLGAYEGTITIRWIIELIGIVVLAYLALAPSKKATYSFVYLALLAIIIGEGMSRYVFYVLGS